MDLVIYTGLGLSGRSLMLTRSSDAVIVGCGHVGAIDEFILAYEDNKPIGVLEGPWATDDVVRMIIEKGKSHHNIIFDKDPKKLVEKVIQMVVIRKKGINKTFSNHNEVETGSLNI